MAADETLQNAKSDVPHVVRSHDVRIDEAYVDWLRELKHRYRSAQVRAAVRVNAEKLLFNWRLGRDLVQKKAEERWGSGVVEQVSLDLRREFPDAEGFSVRNLRYMKQWYLFYCGSEYLLQRPIAELEKGLVEKLQRDVAEVDHEGISATQRDLPISFTLVPWGQHIEIFTRSNGVEEAVFYIKQVIENGLSRPALINCFKANLYEHKGRILNNFTDHLPALQSQLVQEVLKENYDFGFATVAHDLYDEVELEEALTRNVTELLLEMGTGFAFLGRQKEILVGGHTRRIDLLFYHIKLRCYVVCELKAKPFEPEFAGKLNYYVNAVDELLKSHDDNPTIGLLICSDMDKTDVHWSFKGISTPMGVATYNNINIQDALPSQEQLAERMHLLRKDLQKTKRLLSKRR